MELIVFVGELLLSQSVVFSHLAVGYSGDLCCEVCWELLFLANIWGEVVFCSAVVKQVNLVC